LRYGNDYIRERRSAGRRANSGAAAGPQGEGQDVPSKTGVAGSNEANDVSNSGEMAERFKAPVL